MKVKEFIIKTGQKRVYSHGKFDLNKKTIYRDCNVTNTLTGKTINGISLYAPLREELDILRNNFNWEVC